MSDSVAGFDRAPDRYMARGRETVDRMRDEAYRVATKWHAGGRLVADLLEVSEVAGQIAELADEMFAYACETHALKYEDRAGLKDAVTVDLEKARWWRQMAAHVRTPDLVQDPRAGRPGFTPYVRPTASVSPADETAHFRSEG